MWIRGKILVLRLISCAVTVNKHHTNYSYWMCMKHIFCSVMCYTVLIWTVILLTLGNNIVTLLFNWHEPVHYVPTDKINASIRIRIRFRRISKVKMQILTSFVTTPLKYTTFDIAFEQLALFYDQQLAVVYLINCDWLYMFIFLLH